ncbi:MAG: TAXI family TRAP transporter solute-binding subunit [Reyranellaceae bacterium]
MKRRRLMVAGASAVGLAGFAPAALGQKLPSTSVWTSYDLGSSGYAEASGIADSLMKKHAMRVRIVPSGTSIGRLLPITQGKAAYGFLANELYFAAEGTFDFAVPAWGPQDVRVVLARPASVGMAVAKDTGVKEMKDLRGKRIGYVKGNPSVNVKNDAYLAFGGLKRKDVEVVWFGSYNAMKTAIINNQLDAMGSVTTSANMREIEASPRGLTWPPFPAADKAGWERIRKVADFFEPFVETVGAGVSKDKPVELVGYRYPIMATYAKTSADEVYAMVSAIDASMDTIKGITGSAINWQPKRSGRPPADAPWHEGTIRYMKEKGWWTAEDQAWHDQRLARLKKLQAGWKDAQEKFKAHVAEQAKKGVKVEGDEAWVKFWDEYREKTLGFES